MLEGLVIISKRIETNPEEFIGDSEKWVRVDNRLQHVVEDGLIKLTDEEKELVENIKARLCVIREEYHRQQFNKQVFKTLMTSTAEEKLEENPFGQAPIKREGQKFSISKNDLEVIKEFHRQRTKT